MLTFIQFLNESLGNLSQLRGSFPPAVLKTMIKKYTVFGPNSRIIDVTKLAFRSSTLLDEIKPYFGDVDIPQDHVGYVVFKMDRYGGIHTFIAWTDAECERFYLARYVDASGVMEYAKESELFPSVYNFKEIAKHSKVWLIFPDEARLDKIGKRLESRSSVYPDIAYVNPDYGKMLFRQRSDAYIKKHKIDPMAADDARPAMFYNRLTYHDLKKSLEKLNRLRDTQKNK